MPTRDPVKLKATAARYRASDKAKQTRRAWLAKNPDAVSSYHRTLRRKRKAFIHALKNVPCADCGGTFDPVCMDFDHRPGEKKLFSIGDGSDPTLEQIREESRKCDIVCANCHRLRTYRQRDHAAACKAGKVRPCY